MAIEIVGFPIKNGDFPVRNVMKPVEPPRDSHGGSAAAVPRTRARPVRCPPRPADRRPVLRRVRRGSAARRPEGDHWSWLVLTCLDNFSIFSSYSSVCSSSCDYLWSFLVCSVLMLILMLLPLLMMTTMTRMIDVAIPPRHLKNGPMLSSRWPVTAGCFAAVSVSGKELKEVRLWKKMTPLGYTWLRSSP